MNHRRNDPVALAAAKAGMSQATGYRLLKNPKLDASKNHWRIAA